MEKELNIAAILKDKPYYSKLYDEARDINVFYDCQVGDDCEIHCYLEEGGFLPYHYNGTLIGFPKGMQILKPSKEMQDWSKFAWKKGDVLIAGVDSFCIFDSWVNDDYTEFHAKFVSGRYDDTCKTYDWTKEYNEKVIKQYISNIEEIKCGKLNLETLNIEKPKQDFKDGDIVVAEGERINKQTFVCKHKFRCSGTGEHGYTSYIACSSNGALLAKMHFYIREDVTYRPATDSEKQQLFDAIAKENKVWDAEKKAIVDLPKKCEFKAFDKVLVRNGSDGTWRADIYSDYKNYAYHHNCIGGMWEQCIPYNDQTEHLLGTTDDWKGGEE